MNSFTRNAYSFSANKKHNNQNYHNRYGGRQDKNEPKLRTELAQNFKGLTFSNITSLLSDTSTIQKYVEKTKLTSSQLRRWYESILKLITTIKILINNKSILSEKLDIELNILKLIAKMKYDIQRNLKGNRDVSIVLPRTIEILLKKLQNLQTDTNKQELDNIKNYLKQLETFWMLIIAYSK